VKVHVSAAVSALKTL